MIEKLYEKNKTYLNKIHLNIVKALFIVFTTEIFINILFSKVITLIGNSEKGLTQSELSMELAESMLLAFKHSIKDRLNDLSGDNLYIVKEVITEINNLATETKGQLGQFMLNSLIS